MKNKIEKKEKNVNSKTNKVLAIVLTAAIAVSMTACGNNAKDEIDPLLSQSASETASISYLDTGSSAAENTEAKNIQAAGSQSGNAEDTDSETDTGSGIEEKDPPDVDINSVKLSSYAELEVLRYSVGVQQGEYSSCVIYRI